MSDKRVEMKTALGIGGPIIQVTTARGGRKYELPSVPGSPSVPSVTSIIGGTLKSWQLENWKLKWIRDGLESYLDTELSYDTIDAILSASGNEARASAAIGSQMHDIIDGLLQGNQEIVVPDQLEPAVRGFLRWRQAHADWEYIDSEVAVFTQDFAGTVDALFYDDTPGNRCWRIVDWKTSSGIYDSALMQVAAYCYALEDMIKHCEEPVSIPRMTSPGRLLGEAVEGMIVRFDNAYPLDEDNKKIRTLPKVFSDRVQIAKVDRAKWGKAFRHCHFLHAGVKGSIKKEWI
jgi:hypothetical protein